MGRKAYDPNPAWLTRYAQSSNPEQQEIARYVRDLQSRATVPDDETREAAEAGFNTLHTDKER